MAAANVVNISMYLGEDKTYRDKIYQADGVTPQDVSNWQMVFTVHALGDPTAIYFQKGNTAPLSGITPVNPTATPQPSYNWAFSTLISKADTVNMFPGEYEYVFERVDSPEDAVPTKGLYTLLQK